MCIGYKKINEVIEVNYKRINKDVILKNIEGSHISVLLENGKTYIVQGICPIKLIEITMTKFIEILDSLNLKVDKSLEEYSKGIQNIKYNNELKERVENLLDELIN